MCSSDLIEDNLRRDRYLTKLEQLTGIRYNKLEAAAKAYRAGQKAKKPKPEAVARAVQSLRSSPLEEYCLALILQHPELKGKGEDFPPEYFENSENREIFIAWQEVDNLQALKEKLDEAIHEHLDTLINRSLPPNKVEERYADYNRRLKERYFKNLEAKRAEVFASEAESGGTGADLTKLEEEGIEPSVQLKQIFAQKGQRKSETRR